MQQKNNCSQIIKSFDLLNYDSFFQWKNKVYQKNCLSLRVQNINYFVFFITSFLTLNRKNKMNLKIRIKKKKKTYNFIRKIVPFNFKNFLKYFFYVKKTFNLFQSKYEKSRKKTLNFRIISLTKYARINKSLYKNKFSRYIMTAFLSKKRKKPNMKNNNSKKPNRFLKIKKVKKISKNNLLKKKTTFKILYLKRKLLYLKRNKKRFQKKYKNKTNMKKINFKKKVIFSKYIYKKKKKQNLKYMKKSKYRYPQNVYKVFKFFFFTSKRLTRKKIRIKLFRKKRLIFLIKYRLFKIGTKDINFIKIKLSLKNIFISFYRRVKGLFMKTTCGCYGYTGAKKTTTFAYEHTALNIARAYYKKYFITLKYNNIIDKNAKRKKKRKACVILHSQKPLFFFLQHHLNRRQIRSIMRGFKKARLKISFLSYVPKSAHNGLWIRKKKRI